MIRVPPDVDPFLGRIARCPELGVEVMTVRFRENRDPGYMASVAEAAAKTGVDLLIGGQHARFGSPNPDERKADIEALIAALLEFNRHTGITYSSVSNVPMSHNRWSPEPPMDERIDIIGEGLAAVADAVRPAGMTLGLENHCDYRGYECAAMLKKANRPNMLAQLDSGNAFTVFEDPIDCARAMAPWVASVHLKDVKAVPNAGPEWRSSRTETVPLGDGHVDNVEVCRILQELAPDARNLALLTEPLFPGPEVDMEAFLRKSLGWARTHLAPFLG